MTHESTSTTPGGGPPYTAIQLHTLAAIDAPLETIVRRVASAGYEGVEFAGRLLSSDPAPVRAALDETGTRPVAAHVDLPRLEADAEHVVDRCRAVGCRHVVIPHVGAGHFRTTRRVDALADRLSTLYDRLALNDVELALHTTQAMLSPPLDRFGLASASRIPIPGGWRRVAAGLDRVTTPLGRCDVLGTGLGRLLERTPQELSIEVDVGWVAAAGYDPLAVFEAVDDRLWAIHVADVAVTNRYPRAYGSAVPGTGIVDLKAVLAAAWASDADWLVYESDDPPDAERAIRHGVDVLARPAASGPPDAPHEGPQEPGEETEARASIGEPQQPACED